PAVTVSPPNAGLTMMIARRSTSAIPTSTTARSSSGSISRQCQMNGGSPACGLSGVIFLNLSHTGWKCRASNSAMKAASGRPLTVASVIASPQRPAGPRAPLRDVADCPCAPLSVVGQFRGDVGLIDQGVRNEHLLFQLLAGEIVVELVDA